MKLEWQVGIGPLQGLVQRMEDGQACEWRPYHEAIYRAALVERLEAIAEGLERIEKILDARMK